MRVEVKNTEDCFADCCETLKALELEKKLRGGKEHLEGFWTTSFDEKVHFAEMSDELLEKAIRYFHELTDRKGI